jgi:hypothetical protein
MTATVTLVIDDVNVRHECRPDEVVSLTRYSLSHPHDTYLHRTAHDVPQIRFVAGRWQIRYRWPSSKVTVRVVRHDGRGVDARTRPQLEAALSAPSADVFGRGDGIYNWEPEIDLYDGHWVIGILTKEPKWWLIRLHVIGQPAIHNASRDPDARSDVPTWVDAKPNGSSPADTHQWPPFRVPDPVNDARDWLDDQKTRLARMRRIVLGYRYQEYLRNQPGAQPLSRRKVCRDLRMDSEGQVDRVHEQLMGKLWDSGHANPALLCRFLLITGLITIEDLRQAEKYALQFLPPLPRELQRQSGLDRPPPPPLLPGGGGRPADGKEEITDEP